MWTFLSVLVVVAGSLFILQKFIPRLDRALTLYEEAVDIRRTEVTKTMPREGEPMPQFMVEWALNESSEWAREDKLRRMRELYDKLRDWDKVKVAIANEELEAERSTW